MQLSSGILRISCLSICSTKMPDKIGFLSDILKISVESKLRIDRKKEIQVVCSVFMFIKYRKRQKIIELIENKITYFGKKGEG